MSQIPNTYTLRVVPWWTDGAGAFLINVFKWVPKALGRRLAVLEFGGGNSTLFLLRRGAQVVTVEHDAGYVSFIETTAKAAGHRVAIVAPEGFKPELMLNFDLVIVCAKALAEVPGVLKAMPWDMVVNDGVSRREVLEAIRAAQLDTIVILDNAEYCANWGRLDRSSAKPDLIAVYRAMLRDPQWRHYIFEQPEGREGHGVMDHAGWESAHRWASAVLWPVRHVFNQLMVTQLGLPLVNLEGIDDKDARTLGTRCPFDWENMVWLKPAFPPELDLKLERDFD